MEILSSSSSFHSNTATPTHPPRASLSEAMSSPSPLKASGIAKPVPERSTSSFEDFDGLCDGDLGLPDSDNKVTTVFGFPPSEVDIVVKFFKGIGNVREVKLSSCPDNDGNNSGVLDSSFTAGPSWIHILWASQIDAEKALQKQGTILNGVSKEDGAEFQYMIGVLPYSRCKGRLGQITMEDVLWASPKRKEPSTRISGVGGTANIQEVSIFSKDKADKKLLSASSYGLFGSIVASTDSVLQYIFGP